MTNYIVNHDELKEYVKKIFMAFNVNDSDSDMVADMLVNSNLRGVNSHGVLRVSNYTNRLREGGMLPYTECTIVSETPTTAVIDGNNGLGAVACSLCAELARKKAMENNLGFVALRGINHTGTMGYWSMKIAQDDMIAIVGTADEPLMAAPGGKSVVIGNNPFSVAFPSNKHPGICVDMACSVSAFGKLLDYRLRNQPIPLGWFLDLDGKPTTDASKAAIMMPVGGHKGYGIAFAVEALASLLSGGAFGNEHGSQYNDLKNPNSCNIFFFAIKISAFRELEEFKESADSFIDLLCNSQKAEGVDHIYYPGEIEEKHKQKSLIEGIQLDEALVNELSEIALKAGIKGVHGEFLKAKVVEFK
jgi:LDH2 family malate/lactate/ureidoglycolate dehydrogenase